MRRRKLEYLLILFTALGLGRTLFHLVRAAHDEKQNFAQRLLEGRLFMQVAQAVADPQTCERGLGPALARWNRQDVMTPVAWQGPAFDRRGLSQVELSLRPPSRLVVRADLLQREIDLDLRAGCRLNREASRFALAAFIEPEGCGPAIAVGRYQRCPAGQFLTRNPKPVTFACCPFPP